MARRASLLALALAIAPGAAGCLRAAGTREEPLVVELRLEGVKAVDEGALREKLATQASGRWRWSEAHRLDPDALEADRRRVQAYYRARGYYGTGVEVEERREDGRVRVVMRVTEGTPARVASVAVTGLDGAPEARARLGPLPLKVGDVFTEGAFDATGAAIEDALHRTGWAMGTVTKRAQVLDDGRRAEATYEVVPGRRWRFGGVEVFGGAQLPRDKILDQAYGAITPGAWWDESRLALAQTRVAQLGAFGGVRVQGVRPDEARGTIGVEVAIQRAPFRTRRAGFGVGLQGTRWDAHLLAGWQDRNFFGELRKLSTDARLGYAWLPNPWSWTKRGPIGILSGEFSEPGAFTRWVDASARVELEKGIEPAYDFYAERLKLALPLRLAGRWKLSPSYNLEVYNLFDYGAAVSGGTTAGGGTLQNCRGSICLLTYLEQSIAWDGRDDPLNPRRGAYFGISVQQGMAMGGYGYRYLRFQPEARVFWPLGRKAVLALRGRVGALAPVAESGLPPVVALFTAGGPLSMRGYYTRRFAPMTRQGGQWVPIGGNGVADGSLELRFPVAGSVGGAVFLDGGAISAASASPSEWRQALDPGAVQWASGLGLRWLGPVGIVRLDVAARLPDRWSSERSAFPAVPYTRWPDGALHREPIVAVHVSLGEAF